LHFHDDGISADGEAPQPFYLELRDPTRMCIKTAQGRYVNSEKNGGIGVGTSDREAATLWEY
jgi:fascin 1/2